MNEPGEKLPTGNSADKKEYTPIRSKDLGYHYTVDEALPDALEHGLLSRDEERRRGLKVRQQASRSFSDTVYFTTDIDDLYFFQDESGDLQTALSDVVGIAIDRPDYAYTREGHFVEKDVVEPSRFKALVFIDSVTSFGSRLRKKYNFTDRLPEDVLQERVNKLRRLCVEKKIDLPIFGISGDLYWPERKTREEVRLSSFK